MSLPLLVFENGLGFHIILGRQLNTKPIRATSVIFIFFLAGNKKFAVADGFSILQQAESSQTSGAGWAC